MQSYYDKCFFYLFLAILLYYLTLAITALLFDCISLFIVKKTIGREMKSKIGKKHFWLIYLFTVVSYLLSVFAMFIMFAIENGEFNVLTLLLVIYRLVTEPVTNPQITLMYIIAILISVVSNFILNYSIVFKNIYLTRINRLLSAIIVSILNAPYLFLVSFAGIMNNI